MQKNLRIVATIVITLAFIVIFRSLFIIDANLIKELPIDLKVGDIIGFDVNNEELTFGRVPQGSTSIRRITLTNDQNTEVKIILKVEGSVEPFISFQENNFILAPLETKKIEIHATSPLNPENENYQGTLKIYSLKT